MKTASEKQENNGFIEFFKLITDNEQKVKDVEIQQDKFLLFLQSLGFFRYDIEDTQLFVRIKNNVIEEVRISKIKDEIKKIFEDDNIAIPYKELVKRKIIAGSKAYLSEERLTWLDNCNHLQFNQAEPNKAYFYFRNGFVTITPQGWSLHPYTELKGLVWRKQLIDKDFTNLLDIWVTTEKENGVFFRFCELLAHLPSLTPQQNQERFKALSTMIGYLVHDFTDTKLQAINLTDSKVGEDKDENNGRTGKSLIMQALKKITDVCEIKGKSFTPEKSHKYQSLSISTKLVCFNDIKDNFSLEDVYDALTEGYEVERKNKQPFNVVAKTLITSNRPLKINGESDRDRVIEFEVSDYFSSKHTPSDEFASLKKPNSDRYWFFRDWDSAEWNRFFNFIVFCVHSYFTNGLIRPSQSTLDKRKLLNETCKEFIDFMQDLNITFDEVGFSKDYDKQTLCNDFILQYPDFVKISQRRFTSWLHKYAKYTEGFAEVQNTDEWRNQNTKPASMLIRFRKAK